MKILAPAGVVALLCGALLIAASPGRGAPVKDSPPPAVTTAVDDPAFAVPACEQVHYKGPCTAVWRATDGKDHWWYVEIGHTLWDKTARDLGVVEP